MLLIGAMKVLVFGFCMLPIAFSALATGILFACFNLAVSRNPEERDSMFNTTLMGFAFIETFVFMGILVATGVYILI